jgi:hypothetical protein
VSIFNHWGGIFMDNEVVKTGTCVQCKTMFTYVSEQAEEKCPNCEPKKEQLKGKSEGKHDK